MVGVSRRNLPRSRRRFGLWLLSLASMIMMMMMMMIMTILLPCLLETTSVFGFQSVVVFTPTRSSLPQQHQRRLFEDGTSFMVNQNKEEEITSTATLPITSKTQSPSASSFVASPEDQTTGSSWIPRFAVVFICHFHRQLAEQQQQQQQQQQQAKSSNTMEEFLIAEQSTTATTIFIQEEDAASSTNTDDVSSAFRNTMTTSSSSSIAAAKAVVDVTLGLPQDVPEIGPIIDPALTIGDGDGDGDGDTDNASVRFFPVPTTTDTSSSSTARGSMDVDPSSSSNDVPEQAMWNLTQDLGEEDDITTSTTLMEEEPELVDADDSMNIPLDDNDIDIVESSAEEDIMSATTEIDEVSMTEEALASTSTSTSSSVSGSSVPAELPAVAVRRDKVVKVPLSTKQDPSVSMEPTEVDPKEVETDIISVVPLNSQNDSTALTVESDLETIVVQEEEDDQSLEELKRRAAEISHSFYAKEFQPAWFAKNPHLQTITAVKARQESMYFPTTGNLLLSNKFQWDHRQRVETSDGDFFDVDWKYTQTSADHDSDTSSIRSPAATTTTTPLVFICHGLQSNTDSPLTKDMTIAFNSVGMDVAAINFRGCSGEPNRKPMGYHLSFTDDLEFMVKQISTQHPGRPIYLSGFSLGANVVTNFLADMGTKAETNYNIWGAAVNAVPFDLTKCQSINEPGFSGDIYGKLLFKSLQTRILESMETLDYNFTKEELQNCTNCLEFDDLVVCSVYDEFENAEDYHRKSSTHDRLHQIMVPQLIMQALDDPFFVGNINPENDPTLPCRIQYTKHGGHCGYVFHSEESDKQDSSFMPTELARFFEHVQKVRTGQKSTTVALRKKQTPITAEIIQDKLKNASSQEKSRRKMAANAAHAFKTREFVPVEWAKNEHLQTIMGALFRRQTMYINNHKETPSLMKSFLTNYEFQWDERERMSTPDDDFFDVDYKYVRSSNMDEDSPSEDRPLVLICHGLQSDSSSPLGQDMAQAFNDVGMDAGCINFRGCSGEINKTPVGYHLGFTEDLMQMIEHINVKFPGRRIYLSGFSLGANVVTSCLAELGERAYNHNIFGAAVNAVPFDMPKAQLNLNQDGLTKSLYGGRLLASMVDRVEASYDRTEFQFPREEARKCRTIMDMENLVITPIFGFDDAYDYYSSTSTLPKVDHVAVPELVIQARDDPFFSGQSLPVDDPARPLRVQMTSYGGHCGYVFHAKEEESYKTSWMPTELARFLSHLEDTFSSEVA